MNMSHPLRIGIIGAGIGGLAAAARLAHAGCEVTVFERNALPGGKAGNLQVQGFRFDTGPSLLTMPFVVEDLFSDVGEEAGQAVRMAPLITACRYVWPDGATLCAPAQAEGLGRELEAVLNDDADGVARYLAHCRGLYEIAARYFLFRSLDDRRALFEAGGAREGLGLLLRPWRLDPFRSMHRANEAFFGDPRTVQLFDRYATYVGSNPFRIPATFNIIQHVEYSLGAFRVDGGLYRLVEAIAELAVRKGARVQTGRNVERIVVEGGRARGLVVDGEVVEVDAVISNVDVATTFARLLERPDARTARRYLAAEPSTSALVFYWGVRGRHPQMETHNILFSTDYRAEFEDLFARRQCPADPTVYVYLSCRNAPADAPMDCENWYVMINAPAVAGQDWAAETERSREAALARLRREAGVDLRGRILCERVMTPQDLAERTGSHRGSLYGPACHGPTWAFRRQAARCREVRGLYFCGGSVHPGGGIPLVMLSGRFAAEGILRDSLRWG